MTVLAILTAAPAAVSAADGAVCLKPNPQTGVCLVYYTGSGTPAVQPADRPQPAGGPVVCRDGGQELACSSASQNYPGTRVSWSNGRQCYVGLLPNQPLTGDPAWGGHTNGAIYYCEAPGGVGRTFVDRITSTFWSAAPPAALPPNPADVARRGALAMDVRAADIGIVPDDDPTALGAVGAPVWMWTAPGPHTFGPLAETRTEQGITVALNAGVERIVWDMDDGSTVTCRTAGTVYEDRYGFDSSPDCGHRYTRTSAYKPGGAFRVTATSYWVVDWTGPGGTAGRIPINLTDGTAIRVGELQALNTAR